MIDIGNFRPDTIYTIYIAATPEKVWQALTTAEFSRQYFFGFAVEMDASVGGSFIVRAPDGSIHIDGKVLVCDRPRKLAVTWNVNWPRLVEKLGQTVVTYEIALAGDAVRLTLYTTEMSSFAAINEVYELFFESDPPARVAIGVAALPRGAKVEIDAVVAIPD